MREGEILTLREKQIHFLGKETFEGYIELYDAETKTGEGRQVPFVGSVGKFLREYLQAKRKRGPEKFVFTTGNGKFHGNFRRAFQRACKRVCLEEDTCEKKDPKTCRSCEQRGIKGLCFHDTRHTAITNMRKAGVNISVIMAISGHRTDAMFRRYNRIDLNDGREAMQRLERYLSETGIQANQERNEKKKDQRIEDDYCNITATRKNGEIAYA
jgi:integrase